MAKFLVQKSDPLHGEVSISGAKNAVLPLMAAAILPEDVCTISDVPELRDVRVMKEILTSLIKLCERATVLEIDASGLNNNVANYELVRKMRASFLVMGPLRARTGVWRMHLPEAARSAHVRLTFI